MIDPSPFFFVLGLTAVGLLLYYFFAMARKGREKARLEQIEKMQRDAAAFFDHLASAGLGPIETRLISPPDEKAILEADSVLYETRSFRVYGGGGTRIRGIYVGGGASESEQRWKEIDTGRLTLTTKRLVVDGSRENRNIGIADVLSVTPSFDAIEVSSQHRGKAAVFTLSISSPLIWAPRVEQVANGRVTVESAAAHALCPASEPQPIRDESAANPVTVPSDQKRSFFSKPKTQ